MVLHAIRGFISKCHASGNSTIGVLARHARYRFSGKNIVTGGNVTLIGWKGINTQAQLTIATIRFGFSSPKDTTVIIVHGEVNVVGKFSIGRGCRFEFGDRAVVSLGNSYISPNTLAIIRHGLIIGDGCAIAWNCQIFDDDFHSFMPGVASTTPQGAPIYIGNRVWIGSGVTILKGAYIPNGCVVAAGSVVRSAFTDENALIAGNPARVVRIGVSWK